MCDGRLPAQTPPFPPKTTWRYDTQHTELTLYKTALSQQVLRELRTSYIHANMHKAESIITMVLYLYPSLRRPKHTRTHRYTLFVLQQATAQILPSCLLLPHAPPLPTPPLLHFYYNTTTLLCRHRCLARPNLERPVRVDRQLHSPHQQPLTLAHARVNTHTTPCGEAGAACSGCVV